MQSIEIIEKLSNANGVSGFEDDVTDLIKGMVKDFSNIEEDSMRNLILKLKNYDPEKPTVMLDGHADEVGFMVQSIKPNGTIKFLTLGGWFSQNISAHRVRVRNPKGKYITGIVSSKPPHFMTEAERKKIVEVSDMAIDIGATSREEVIDKYGIEHGAPIVPDVTFEYRKDNGIMIGKAFDNRIGCALVVDVLQRLQGKELSVNVVGGISAQEEVGTRGAEITGRAIKPDAAIVFEGTPADDTHKQPAEIQGGIRKGVQIRHRDRSYVSNPRFVKMARDLAKEKEITFQDAVREGGGTDAGKIALSHIAVPVLVLGIPVRYAHTHYGISAYEDYENALSLALEVINNLSKDKIGQL